MSILSALKSLKLSFDIFMIMCYIRYHIYQSKVHISGKAVSFQLKEGIYVFNLQQDDCIFFSSFLQTCLFIIDFEHFILSKSEVSYSGLYAITFD